MRVLWADGMSDDVIPGPTKYRGRIAMQSTGDPERDALTIRKAELEAARMDAGACPNGCGPLRRIDDHNRECPACHFHGWQNVPLPPGSP